MLILRSKFKNAKYKRVLLNRKNVTHIEEHPDGYTVVYTECGGNIISHCVEESFETVLDMI